MTYTHLTTDELVMIESYFKINQSVAKTAHCLNRSRQTIHKVYLFFKQGKSALEYYQQYKKNKSNCGRRPLVLPEEQSEYIQRKGCSRMDTRCDCWSCSVSYSLFCSYHLSYVQKGAI